MKAPLRKDNQNKRSQNIRTHPTPTLKRKVKGPFSPSLSQSEGLKWEIGSVVVGSAVFWGGGWNPGKYSVFHKKYKIGAQKRHFLPRPIQSPNYSPLIEHMFSKECFEVKKSHIVPHCLSFWGSYRSSRSCPKRTFVPPHFGNRWTKDVGTRMGPPQHFHCHISLHSKIL